MAHTSTDIQLSAVSEARRERERTEMTDRIIDVAREMFFWTGS